jgi:pimeloyl-ACP methyl ester carboxylesterase
MAIEVAHRHPDQVRSLLLVSAYAGWNGSLTREDARGRLDRALREAGTPAEQWAPGYLPGFFAGPVPQPLVDAVLEIMGDTRPNGIKAMAQALGNVDLRDACEAIKAPTLPLYGSGDTRAPLEVAYDLNHRIPGSQLVVLPGVGHLIHIEAPESFDQQVRLFLRQTDSGELWF